MSDGPVDLAALRVAIADVRRQFFSGRERLEETLGRAFDDPASAADVLLSLADEYGPDQAVALLRERPFDVGELLPDPDIADDLEAQLSDIAQTQDRLDDLTARREELAPGRAGARILNIQGEEHEIDGNELRSVERPNESISLEALSEHIEQEQSLVEAVAATGEVPLAQPLEQERDRSRGR